MTALGAIAGRRMAELGAVMQLAYVPADIDAALAYWTKTMGVGPFYAIDHVQLEDVRYKGAPADIDFSLMLAYWGDTQIELIQQHNDAPSIFRTWRDQGRDGLHHVCMMVDDFANARAVVAHNGFEIVQEGRLASGAAVMYVEADGGAGTMVEILTRSDETDAVFGAIKAAARAWDGTDPVRRFS